MINDNAKNKKTIATFILIIFAIGLFGLASFPFIRLFHINSELENRNDLKIALEQQIKKIKSRNTLNKKRGAIGSNKALMLAGETIGIAGANLQKQITQYISKYKGEATTFQVLSPKQEENVTRVSMNITLTADVVGLQNILHELETGLPLIFIDNIIINGENITDRSPYEPVKLNITMQVSGFVATQKKV